MSSSKTIMTRVRFGVFMILVLVGLFAADIRFYHSNVTIDSPVLNKYLSFGLLVQVVVAMIAVVLSLELLNFAKSSGAAPFSTLTVIATFLVSFPYLNIFLPGFVLSEFFASKATLICVFLILFFAAQILRRDTIRAGSNITWSLFIVVYAGLLFSYISLVRFRFGPWAVILMISAVKGSDIGAYFTGTMIGRHKLIPWLSPGKSVEGLFGAMIFGGGIVLGLVNVLPSDRVILALYKLGTVKLVLLGVFLAITGQFGDLSESLLKRDANMKDSARLIPEFGGFCDLLDSVLPTGFVWYWVLKLILSGS